MAKRLFICIVTLLALFALPVAAQKKQKEDTTTRSLQGTVTDSTGNLVEGAVVKLKDTKTLGVRSFITKADGNYHFHGLNPDIDYEVKADYQGASSSNRTLSSFDTRRPAIVNLKLEAKK
jgi:protocatechuate 3,4-dioxygenase beta subunit